MATTTTSIPRLHVLTVATQRADDLTTVDAVLAAGAPAIQVRVKDAVDRDHLAVASAITERCLAAGAICIVNDRPDIALACEADGVHLGADDLPVAAVRRLAGDRLLIGGTARDPATAQRLEESGADYLGVGPIHPTSTKDGLPDPLGLERLAAICSAVSIPVIAISGLTAEHVPDVRRAGAAGVAVTGAVMAAADPAGATRQLLDRLGEAI